jgi:hypothetical protein
MTNNNTDFFLNLDWDKSTEQLLVTWADHAACFSWVYDRSYRRYENLNNRISVPVIIIGTIVGVLSVGINSLFPPDFIDTAQKILGGVNILMAIAGTIQNKYRFAQLSELHLNSFIEWQKFERSAKVGLAIAKEDRKPASEYIRILRHDYEKLMNNNPILPIEIIEDFRNTFKSSNIIKPEILDTISHTTVFDEYKTVTPVNLTDIRPSYLKRLASVIPFTKTYKNLDKLFTSTPKSVNIYRENRSQTPSDKEINLEDIRNNLKKNETITISTKDLQKSYEDEFIVTPVRKDSDIEEKDINDFTIHEEEKSG